MKQCSTFGVRVTFITLNILNAPMSQGPRLHLEQCGRMRLWENRKVVLLHNALAINNPASPTRNVGYLSQRNQCRA